MLLNGAKLLQISSHKFLWGERGEKWGKNANFGVKVPFLGVNENFIHPDMG